MLQVLPQPPSLPNDQEAFKVAASLALIVMLPLVIVTVVMTG